MKVSCDGFDINYVIEGQGPPVTLIHGVGSELQTWDEVAERLAPEFQVVRLDLRGCGRSTRLTQRCELEDLVADVRAVLDAADISRTDLIGFSLGGMVAQAFALTHPERIRKLGVMSAVAGRTANERRQLSERAQKIRREGVASVLDKADQRWFTSEFRAAHPEIVKARLAELLANDPTSYAEAYRVFAESDVGDRIHDIPHRTLIVTGENDVGSNPRMARFMHRQIGDSRLVILPDLKHSLLLEASETVAELLLGFIRE